MKLNVYRDEDMKGETPFMSFENVKKGDLIPIKGLASNTTYWIRLLDDKEEDIDFNGSNKFSTLLPNKDYIGHKIKTIIDDRIVRFFLYDGDNIDDKLEGLSCEVYELDDNGDPQKVEIEGELTFTSGVLSVTYEDINNGKPFFITVSKDGEDIADSELVKIDK